MADLSVCVCVGVVMEIAGVRYYVVLLSLSTDKATVIGLLTVVKRWRK